MFTGYWILVYTITIASGPPADTQGQKRKYPHQEIAFEPPGDWQGCARIKYGGAESRRKKQIEDLGSKGVVVTARCRQIGKE